LANEVVTGVNPQRFRALSSPDAASCSVVSPEGRTPRDPRDGRDAFAPKPTAQRNFTDPDSKIMKMSDGAFHQCFNAQAIVDSASQVIVAAELSNRAPDCPALEGALDQLDENLTAIGAELAAGATLIADAGYFSADNVTSTSAHGLDAHIATGRHKHSDPPPLTPRGPVPKDATPKQLDFRIVRPGVRAP